MTRGERLAFGGRLEAAKAAGHGGTKNRRGDFTRAELCAEARGRHGAAGIDRVLAGGDQRLEAERRVRALAGQELEAHRHATLWFAAAVLRLRGARWALRSDDELVACSGEEEALAELAGHVVTTARLRARDGALALCFGEDPYAPALELCVRGPRRAEAWELTDADAVLTTANASGIRVHG